MFVTSSLINCMYKKNHRNTIILFQMYSSFPKKSIFKTILKIFRQYQKHSIINLLRAIFFPLTYIECKRPPPPLPECGRGEDIADGGVEGGVIPPVGAQSLHPLGTDDPGQPVCVGDVLHQGPENLKTHLATLVELI